MKSNFDFLGQYWPALAVIGKTVESYLYTDANGCIYKLGLFGERVVKEIFFIEQLPLPENDDTQAGRIRVLKRERLLPPLWTTSAWNMARGSVRKTMNTA